jgi:hypothetical protein
VQTSVCSTITVAVGAGHRGRAKRKARALTSILGYTTSMDYPRPIIIVADEEPRLEDGGKMQPSGHHKSRSPKAPPPWVPKPDWGGGGSPSQTIAYLI